MALTLDQRTAVGRALFAHGLNGIVLASGGLLVQWFSGDVVAATMLIGAISGILLERAADHYVRGD